MDAVVTLAPPDPRLFVHEAHRVLQPMGRLLFSGLPESGQTIGYLEELPGEHFRSLSIFGQHGNAIRPYSAGAEYQFLIAYCARK